MTNQSNSYATRVIGTGSGFPERRLTNADLAKQVETNDEWIVERTGIRERRISDCDNPAEHNSSLALTAAKNALEMAGKTAEDIDAIVYATCTPDTLLPSTACWLQKKLGAKNAWGFDLNAACSGFVFGLATADQFIRSGQVKTALVVGSDVLSAFTNWKDRGSCILFGDGSGAFVVERVDSDAKQRILSSHMHTDGNLWELFHIQAGGSRLEVTPEAHEKGLNKMEMKGREIFKVAVRTLADFAVKAIETNGLKLADIDWIVPHQANLRIIEGVAKRLDIPMEKMLVNIDRFGNTSAATVPTAFDEGVRTGKIKPGQLVLLDVFGAGLTYGSVLLRF